MTMTTNGYGASVPEDNEDEVASPAAGASLDCAWCGCWFEDISDLLGHVDTEHLGDDVAA
jgi:hypothetical protein